ncbi:DUF6124 family protein, partial [Pseudomonas sp. PA-4-8C]|uniref:DUF6124 family protein n=1 Tax=Pseudomonas sp. PA-4-8C TaxID=2665476 RepID=UPI003FA710DE
MTRATWMTAGPGIFSRASSLLQWGMVSDVSHSCFRLSLGTSLTNLWTVAANSAAGFDRPTPNCICATSNQAFSLRLLYRVAAAVRGIPPGMPGSLGPVGQPAYSCHPNSFDREPWQLHIPWSFTMIKDSPPEQIFIVRPGLDTETLLINASQDLSSITDIATHLAFEIDGTQRNVALGICRML